MNDNIMQDMVTVSTLDTIPCMDGYQSQTGGMTCGALKMNPVERDVWWHQETNDNAQPADEAHGLILCERPESLVGEPNESALREFLEGSVGQELLNRVCDGYNTEWNGHNIVGVITDDANEAWNELLTTIVDTIPEIEYQSVSPDDWYCYTRNEIGVEANSTDDQLRDIARDLENELGEEIILTSSLFEYLREIRSGLNE